MKLSFLALAALAVPFAIACSAPTESQDGTSVGEANTTRVAAGSFELYGVPNHTPNPQCDRHTRLELKADPANSAHLEEALRGSCEIAVIPNARDYELHLASTDCGTRIYEGEFTRGIEHWSVKITDNRSRLCENVVAAAVIVEESRDNEMGPMTFTSYSNDRAQPPPSAEALTLSGTLTAISAVGGETTGFGIDTGDGSTHELVLDEGEQDQFKLGAKARLKGEKTRISGVVILSREAFDVKQMLVCPAAGTINCQPGPNRRLSSLCAEGNRSWAAENCAGVDFID